MAEHGQAGECGHDRANAKVFVTFAKLLHGRLFIGVVHEINIALENFRIKFQRVFNQGAVAGIVFIAQHVHEG